MNNNPFKGRSIFDIAKEVEEKVRNFDNEIR